MADVKGNTGKQAGRRAVRAVKSLDLQTVRVNMNMKTEIHLNHEKNAKSTQHTARQAMIIIFNLPCKRTHTPAAQCITIEGKAYLMNLYACM